MFWNKNKDANPCIKHKLWGKLKERAKFHYRIFPVEGSDLWTIKYWSKTYDMYDDFIYTGYKLFENIKEAQKQLEKLRTSYFHKLCENALYMRKCNRVANL